MKKISLLVFTALITVVSFSQEKPKFGLKGGLNLGTVGTNGNNPDSRTSFHLGGLAHIHLAPEWALQPEVVFSGQGYEVNGSYHEKLSYINVPIMVQYMFNNGFRLEAGPQIGLMVDAERELKNGTTSDRDKAYETIDLGAGLGASYLTDSGLGFGARYNLGLTNINDASSGDIKNRVLQLGVFYLFDHQHKAKSK